MVHTIDHCLLCVTEEDMLEQMAPIRITPKAKWPPSLDDNMPEAPPGSDDADAVRLGFLLLQHQLKHKHRTSASALLDEVKLLKETVSDSALVKVLPKTRKGVRRWDHGAYTVVS